MRRALAALACATVLLAGPNGHAATAASADYSDLWWNASESGWGAHVTLQDDVVFMVLFVYDAARQPRFLVAPDMRRAQAAGAADVFEGELYATTGPPFPGAFDATAVSRRLVGAATLRFEAVGAGQLTYTVDGAEVAKAITRQSWRPPELAGEYLGGLFATATTCPSGLPGIAYPGSLTISQAGDAVTIESRFEPGFSETGICRMAGRLQPQGSLARIGGSYECDFFNEPGSVSGTFSIDAVRAGESGFSGRYEGREGAACVHAGHIGGVRQGYVPAGPGPEPDPED